MLASVDDIDCFCRSETFVYFLPISERVLLQKFADGEDILGSRAMGLIQSSIL